MLGKLNGIIIINCIKKNLGIYVEIAAEGIKRASWSFFARNIITLQRLFLVSID